MADNANKVGSQFTLVQRVTALSAAVVLISVNSTMLAIGSSRVVQASEAAAINLSALHRSLAAVVGGVGDLVLSEGSKSSRELVKSGTDSTEKFFPEATTYSPEVQKAFESWKNVRSGVEKLLAKKNIAADDDESLIAYGALQEQLSAITKTISDAEASSVRAASDKTEHAFLVIVVCLVVITVISTLTGVLVVKAIRNRVGGDPREVVRIVRSIVAGDLAPKSLGHAVAAGSILAEMQDMQGTLSTMVDDIHRQSDELANVAEDIGSASSTLHDRTLQASSQLAQSASATSDLSDKASQAADMARQASAMSTAASQTASQGGEAVGRVVDTMQQINESSQKISDIISVIDGIAFQTNILALNAAVEAARAGEQGRGFAVVASEVRALAGRSAEAAREIKALIVRSVESVEAGRHQVERAGATMNDIVSGVAGVTDLIAQISQAASGQRDALASLTQTIGAVDEITKQNVQVVDDSAAATQRLREQAARLVSSVSRFQT
jgi:methyl-accepting chemotaxis protein